MKKLNNKGFTLIEVLSVLVILSVIMLIALPNVSTSLERSKASENTYEKGLYEKYAELYISNNKKSVYEKMGSNNTCYLSSSDLIKEGYGSGDIKTKGYVIFNKTTGDYEFSSTTSGVSCK